MDSFQVFLKSLNNANTKQCAKYEVIIIQGDCVVLLGFLWNETGSYLKLAN